MSTNKWHHAVDSAIKHVRYNRLTKLEWRKFTEEKIKILEDLSTLPFPNFVQKYNESIYVNDGIIETLNHDKEFLQQCLNIVLEQQVKLQMSCFISKTKDPFNPLARKDLSQSTEILSYMLF